MSITRRSLIKTALAIPAAATLPFHSGYARPALLEAVVVISGLHGDTPVTKAEAVFKEFLKQGIPLAIGISVGVGNERSLKPKNEIAVLLRKLSDDFPDHIEIVIELEGIAGLDPYFLLRRVTQAQSVFIRALNPLQDYYQQSLLTGLSLVTPDKPVNKEQYEAIRAAGFRTIIHTSANNSTRSGRSGNAAPYVMSSNGVARLVGDSETSARRNGSKARLQSPDALKKTIKRRISAGGPIILDIPLAAFARLDQAETGKYVTQVSTMLHNLRTEKRIWPLTPHTLYKSRHNGPHRYVIVRVDDHRIAINSNENHQNFLNALLARGIPLSDGVIPIGYGKPYSRPLSTDDGVAGYINAKLEDRNYEASLHGFEHMPRELTEKSAIELQDMMEASIKEFAGLDNLKMQSLIPPNNAFSDQTLQAMAACGLKTISADHGDYTKICGMDAQGILHASNTVKFEKNWSGKIQYWPVARLLEHIGRDNDAVFMIHPATLDEPEKRKTLADALLQLSEQRGNRLVNLQQYRKAVLPRMEKLELTLNSRFRTSMYGGKKLGPQPGNQASQLGLRTAFDRAEEKHQISPELRSKLMHDAKTAWGFFERNHERKYLVPAATIWEDGSKIDSYPYIRMWDVGSIITASLSAHYLKMISQSEFEKRINNVRGFLKKSVFKHAGMVLPNYETHISGVEKSKFGFDSADTGRLLTCLKILESYTNGVFDFKSLVEGWDIQKTILKGEMHDFRRRRSWSEHKNIYAQYASRGYELWGIKMNPVYEDSNPLKDMDSTMRFLQDVKTRGPISTEPSVTEEIELGFSQYSKLIADTLFMAQIERYKQTGILTCTSEGPTDRRPWFTYQAYQIEGGKNKWVVHSSAQNRKFETSGQAEDHRMVNSKAAFLWMAVRPEPYSEKLHAYIRQRAATKRTGFASGVFEVSGKRTLRSDANTNGIILEAIAYMINNRNPLINLAG